jgi:DNA-binding XRE family transcriptional regulator
MGSFSTFITPSGEAFAVIPLAEFEHMQNCLSDIEEDKADLDAYLEAKANLISGKEHIMPPEVTVMVRKGTKLLTALRKWRGLTQVELAKKTRLTQGFICDLEAGRRGGSQDTLQAIATALDVPVHFVDAIV